jgi:amidase
MTVEPGETIVVETINHMTPIVRSEADLHPHGSPDYREREETGPIYVQGAQPGDVLAVHIEKIEFEGYPHAHGCGPLADKYPQKPLLLPIEDEYCRLPGGLRAPLAPMVGDIYTTPTEPPKHVWDHDHGGNMDFTEVRPGNTLYLPVFRAGGLLVLGDVHSIQGDGEIYGEGGESAAEVTITLDIDRRYRHPRPLVETPDALIGLGSRDSLQMVTEDMTGLVSRLHGVSEQDAYIYCCVAGSLRLAGCLARRDWVEQFVLLALSVPKEVR